MYAPRPDPSQLVGRVDDSMAAIGDGDQPVIYWDPNRKPPVFRMVPIPPELSRYLRSNAKSTAA